MYEAIAKWKLDLSTQEACLNHEKENSVIIEAIRVKNQIVMKRYELACSISDELTDLISEIELHLDQITDELSLTDAQFRNHLSKKIHPAFYRKFRKIRTKLDRTNDLISAYSMRLSTFINYDEIKNVIKFGKCDTPQKIIRTYRIMWTFVLSTISRLIRITSNDLRFWLTDIPYFSFAYEWATKDIDSICGFLISNKKDKSVVILSLEHPEQLVEFWNQSLAE